MVPSTVSPTPTPHRLLEAQARLDDEIAALTLATCNLRTQRNSLSPICRLPPEILASIFVHYAQRHKWSRTGASRGIPDWVDVSYVCRHWREVALNCPILWSLLFASSCRWTDELLARSKASSLTFCMDAKGSNRSEELHLLERMAAQAHRIQILGLRLTHQEAERIFPLLSTRAPLLQELCISLEESFFGEPTLVSGTLFDGDTPALRKLELINFAFPLTSPTLSGLTSLRLRDLNPSSQATLADLKLALSRMKDMAHLHLENCLSDSSTEQPFEGSERLHFPRLSRLSIVATLPMVVHLLACFEVPLKTKVRLRCNFQSIDEDYTTIYPLIARRFMSSEDQTSTRVPIIRTCIVETVSSMVGFIFSTVDCDGFRAFSLEATSYSLGLLNEDWDRAIPLKVDIVLSTSLSKDRETLIRGVCCSMPLARLRNLQLYFDTNTSLSSAFWAETFGHLNRLRYINLSQVNMEGLIQELVSPLEDPQDNGSEDEVLYSDQTFVSALRELELYRIDFEKSCNTQVCSYCVRCLEGALYCRREKGYADLEQLGINECTYVYDCEVEDLRRLVANVDWDKITTTLTDPESEDEEEEEEEFGDDGDDYTESFWG